MKKAKAQMRKNDFKDNLFVFKWLLFVSAFLILGGVISFALILLTAHLIGEQTLSPIWIVGMIPLMLMLAVPITFIVYRKIKSNLSVLLKGMATVADGDLNVYIPTAEAKDFASVYENFNKMVAEIQSAESMRTTMFDALSHELKTPIASINGFAKILNEKTLTDEKRKQYMQIIIDESERLGNLVKNVLFLSKLDAQEIICGKAEFDLSNQITDCIISLENDWTSKNIDMSADLSECKFCGDADLLKSLWLNLLSNAIKFTPKNGEINVKMTEDKDNITVSISDNGIGMSNEVLEHIFEKHYQADKSSSAAGQGLGLAITKRITRLCGGTISAESREGEGSTFTVVLPKHKLK